MTNYSYCLVVISLQCFFCYFLFMHLAFEAFFAPTHNEKSIVEGLNVKFVCVVMIHDTY